MLLWGCSLPGLKGFEDWRESWQPGKTLKTATAFKKAKKTIWEITSCSDSLQSPGKSWRTSFLKSDVIKKGKMMTGNRQHGFTMDLLNLPRLTKLVAKYLSKKHLWMRREKKNITYFVQVFDTACQALLPPSWDVAALMRGQLSEKQLDWAQKAMVNESLSKQTSGPRGRSCSLVRLQTEFTDGLWIILSIITITTEEIWRSYWKSQYNRITSPGN